MNGHLLVALRVFVFVLTLVLLAGHSYLPPKTLNLLPEHVELAVYADEIEEGGKSRGEWVDESIRQYACHIKEGLVHRYCGLAIKFHDTANTYLTLDLREYESLHMHLDYDGPAERLNFYYRHTDITDKAHEALADGFQSDQYIFTYLDKPELNKPIIIELSNFDIADWWLQANYTNRSQIKRGLKNIIEFGINTDSNPPFGDYIFTLHKLEAQGEWITKEAMYYYIVVMWLIAALLEGLYRALHLVKEKHRYANTLEALTADFKDLEDTAVRDHLTKLYNRTGLLKLVKRIQNSGEFSNFYLYVFDIDHFKNINDTHGHDAGDAILQQLAQRISDNIREEDHFARWGGEEFVLITQQKTPEGALYFANKLRNVVADTLFKIPNQTALRITTSIGLSRFHKGISFDKAFKIADQNLYQAKHQGRNQVIFNAVHR